LLGGLVRRRRLQAGLTQKELARLAGIAVRGLRDIEQGRARPRPLTVQRLADALDLGADDRDVLAGVAASVPPVGPAVSVLGPLSVRRGDAPVDVSAPLRRDLLGLLAVQNHHVVTVAEIVEVLWGDDPPATYPSQIAAIAAALRQCLEPERSSRAPSRVLVRTGPGYRLDLDDAQFDLARFERLVREAADCGDPVEALTAYRRALDLWRGPVLAGAGAGLDQHPVVVSVGRRLVTTTVAFADLALAHGDPGQALPVLHRAVAQHPLHEGLAARLMRVLAGTGEHAAALSVFAGLRDELDRELGIAPGAATIAVRDDLLRRAVPTHLPRDVPAFTGRREEMASLDLLRHDLGEDEGQPPAVCVIGGPPGVGKTALATHWARLNRSHFPDGQLYLDLQGFGPASQVVDPADAIAGLLEALGVPAARQPTLPSARIGHYRTALTGRRVLVVLDNARDAEQVRPLLPGSPGCLVLVTSRSRMSGLVVTEAAHALTLESLTDQEAMDLLARRIGAARIVADRPAAEEIVERCAGLPLALAIVAARALLRPAVALSRIAVELRGHRRLAALAVDAGADARADLSAVFTWSYEALPAEAQRCFRLIGFAPGPTIAVASAAALIDRPDARSLLDHLVHAQLIVERDDDRYVMHDLLRDYAHQFAVATDADGERSAALRRLGDHLVVTADAAVTRAYPERLRVPLPLPAPAGAAPRFDGERQALEWVHAELPNLAAAATHAAEHGPHRTAWLLADILRAYFWAGHGAGQAVVVADAALRSARADEDLLVQAAAGLCLGQAYYRQARYRESVDQLRLAGTLAEEVGWQLGQAEAVSNIGDVLAISGSTDAADRYYRQALDIQERLGLLAGAAGELNSLTVAATLAGDLGQARRHAMRALELARQARSVYEEATALGNLGELDRYTADLDDALDRMRTAIALNEQIDRPVWVAANLDSLAAVHRDRGEFDAALHQAESAHTLIQQLNRPHIEACILNTLGTVALLRGRPGEAADRHRRALALAEQADDHAATGFALLGLGRAEQGEALTTLRRALDLSRAHRYPLLEADVLVALVEHHCRDGRLASDEADAARALHRRTGYLLGARHLGETLRAFVRHDA
jgi:DNA-binding SARP family transcriptional activator/tetratricopeptide (TPR) repeat protein/DNA-binding XRE family transcriptional regulator